jgi:Ethanolamine utilization protein EutJ (predicted chaperonin)
MSELRFIVKVIEAPGVPGNKALALCTEDGALLPMQQACTVECGVGEMGVAVVRFYIDGEQIRFADDDGAAK